MADNSPLILSFGSVNIDLTVGVETLPKAGETQHAGSYTVGLGGKGANQAAAAARLCRSRPIRVALAGRTGTDSFATLARDTLTTFGVECSPLLEDREHATGIALIHVDKRGENCITVVGGANQAVSETDIRAASPLLKTAQVLLLQLECPLPAVIAAAQVAHAHGGLVIVDPAPAPEGDLPEELWQNTDIVTPNETETERLTGIRPETPEAAARAAHSLRNKGAKAALIKMGGRGTYWQDVKGEGFIPPFPVNPIDTVAAGDCFNAGLAVALTLNYSLAQAVRFASACGALATTRKGAADAAPTWEEVQNILA
ncbi:ribokinase [Acetobacter cibinongensis]|uniref:Ribokinase n=1 Tax=Acetobacter cibinongensis TaxID=146475 RepID=A0A1Z5YVX7_9PROT|nr:ribokinase [Acetobacter cibinongensis]OUJ03089.1 ribokinase [Acetobacter cibinongensis]